jgi:hypothetical protein
MENSDLTEQKIIHLDARKISKGAEHGEHVGNTTFHRLVPPGPKVLVIPALISISPSCPKKRIAALIVVLARLASARKLSSEGKR